MFFFRILLLAACLLCAAVPVRAAQQYVDDDGVYSFAVPDGWVLSKRAEPMPVVVFGPVTKKGVVICHSMKLPSESARGGNQAQIVDSLVAAKINETGIKSADQSAANFTTTKMNIADGVAVRTTYDATGEMDGVKGKVKVTMVLAHNTHTGHTVDISCRATEAEWNAGASSQFEGIQASMTMHAKDTDP